MKFTLKFIAVIISIYFTGCTPDNPTSPDITENVYVVGYEDNGTVRVAKYWKNGVAVILTDGTKHAKATSIFLQGNDVYVCGQETINFKSVAKYWKNGVAVTLSNGTTDCDASSIFVSGSDVYVVGQEGTLRQKLFCGRMEYR